MGARLLAPYSRVLTRTAAGRTALMWGAMSRPWRVEPGEADYLIRNVATAPGWRETLDWTSGRRAEGLEQVRCPVLIAWGTLDTVLLARQGPRFVRGSRTRSFALCQARPSRCRRPGARRRRSRDLPGERRERTDDRRPLAEPPVAYPLD